MALISRSILFVPAARVDRIDKALECGADEVVVDLEDAVAPADKDMARDRLADWLDRHQGPAVLVRVNDARTPWFADDLRMIQRPGVSGVMLPKTESVDEIAAVSHGCVLPMIETAFGLSMARSLAKALKVRSLVFGSIDFEADLDIEEQGAELAPYRAELVLASRLAGIVGPVDGVCAAIDDLGLVAQQAASSRRAGFSGKLCIHPRQVLAVNEAFSPTDEQVQWARRVIDSLDAVNGAAVAVDGKMVDLPMATKARRVLASAERSTP